MYVDARRFNLSIQPDNVDQFVEIGTIIKRAVSNVCTLHHPDNPELNFIYGTIFTSPPSNPDNHCRNVCVFADGEVDRSPTGTGVSGRIAIERARHKVSIGMPITIESILRTEFTVEIVKEASFGPHSAVVPRVTGEAYITGMHSFIIDPDDPLSSGFLLR